MNRESFTGLVKLYLWVIVLAIVVAYAIRSMVIESYRIPTFVMKPTLMIGDVVFSVKLPFGVRLPFSDKPVIKGRAPHYGEVVVYETANDSESHFVKRVVGLPGDTVQIERGKLILNNKSVPVETPPDSSCGSEAHPEKTYSICMEAPFIEDFGPQTVPEESAFLLGDYRSAFAAKTAYEMVPFSNISGKISWIWISVDPFAGADDPKNRWFPKFRWDRMLKEVR